MNELVFEVEIVQQVNEQYNYLSTVMDNQPTLDWDATVIVKKYKPHMFYMCKFLKPCRFSTRASSSLTLCVLALWYVECQIRDNVELYRKQVE